MTHRHLQPLAGSLALCSTFTLGAALWTAPAQAQPRAPRSASTVCDGGACRSQARPTRVNFGRKDPRWRQALSQGRPHRWDRRVQDWVEDQKESQAVLTHARTLVAAGSGDTRLELRLLLPDVPFNLGNQRDRAAREEAVAQRTKALAPSQLQLEHKVQALRGEIIGRGFLDNHVDVWLPAAELESLWNLGLLERIELHEADDQDEETDWGGPRREILGLDFAAWRGRGYTGARGGGWSSGLEGVGNEVLVGIMEPKDGVNRFHRSFLDWAGGPSNIVGSYRCRYRWFRGRRCWRGRALVADRPTHGTRVASVLMGSLEQGQDPDLPQAAWTVASGIATEAKVLYYHGDGAWNLVTSLSHAVGRGVDVVNMSRSRTNDFCRAHRLGGVRTAVERATDAGALIVVSAGNDASMRPGLCSVNSYATIPDAMAIGALDAAYNLDQREDMRVAAYSGRGTVPARLASGREAQHVLVDLVAMGSTRSVAGAGPGGYDDRIQTGTSFSAPQVAGAAALLRDWANARGGLEGLEFDAYAIRVLLSVMGDGKRSTPIDQGEDPRTTLDPVTGFGALRMVALDEELGDGAWRLARHELVQGQELVWPVGEGATWPQSVQGWKFAALVDHNSLADAPDLSFELIDRCPASGAPEETLLVAPIQGLKARLALGPNHVEHLRGRCLWVRAKVQAAHDKVRLYTADYSFSSEPSEHLHRDLVQASWPQ